MQWMKFDAGNPPDTGKKFLVYCGDDIYCVAKFEQWYDKKLKDWFDCSNGEIIVNVTHFAYLMSPLIN